MAEGSKKTVQLHPSHLPPQHHLYHTFNHTFNQDQKKNISHSNRRTTSPTTTLCSGCSIFPKKKLSDMTMEEYLLFKAGVMMSNEEKSNQINNLTELINNVKSNDPELQLQASYIFGQILTGVNPPWQKVIEAKILKRFVYFLDQEELPQLQYEGIEIISSLVQVTEYIGDLIEHGVLPSLLDLLKSPIDITRAMAITALGNIAQETPRLCERVLKILLNPLLTEFNSISMLRLFCSKKPELNPDTVNQVLVVLAQNLNSSNEQILIDACWTLLSLCEVSTSRGQVVINESVCQKLIELLDQESILIVEPALQTVANIWNGDEMPIKYIKEFGMLPRLVRTLLITKYDDNMKNNACKTICSIASTGSNQIQEVVGYGVVYVLADMFKCSDTSLKMEVTRAISIVTSSGTNEALRFVGEKCVEILCDMLHCSGGSRSILIPGP